MGVGLRGFLMAIACAAGAAEAVAPKPLGELTRFWRYRPVVDRWLVNRLGFATVPAYLSDPALSFPYRCRPAAEEIPFADHVTVVRLLGGWSPAWKNGERTAETPIEAYDLAYRDAEGAIRYRWHLLGPRLDPYAEAGYGLTIVLDNTPWCFPEEPDGRAMGQAAPPADFGEWGTFVQALCEQLVTRYGFEKANGWRFRMGTECQGTERFSGTQEQFHRLYDTSASAVRRVLPGAAFGPFNLAGEADEGNVRFYQLAAHRAGAWSPASDSAGPAFDFAPVSIYTAPSVHGGRLRTTDPEFKAGLKVAVWEGVAERFAQLGPFSREVHEFGILRNEFRVGGGEPGARGAAWTFHMMASLLKGGLDRMWHWTVMETVNVRERHKLLMGTGWLLSILEHAAGGDVYALEPEFETCAREGEMSPDLQAIAEFERPRSLETPGAQFVKSLAVVHPERTFLITSVYNEDRFVTRPLEIRLTPPADLLPETGPYRVRQTALTRRGSVYYRIRQDLQSAGRLTEEIAAVPGLLSRVKAMGGRAAWETVDEHWNRYETVIRDSLTLKPYGGTVERDRETVGFRFRAGTPSVTVLVVE